MRAWSSWTGRSLASDRVWVVAVVVVVEGGFGVGVLAGVAEWGVCGGVAVEGGGAPEGGAGVAGDVAGFVDEFGGCADEVGDDGEEAAVVLVLGAWFAF